MAHLWTGIGQLVVASIRVRIVIKIGWRTFNLASEGLVER